MRHVCLKTKRWDEPREPDDGIRLLVTRLWPRGWSKQRATWDAWWKQLGPSRELLRAWYGKDGPRISWDEYRARYLDEMRAQTEAIREFAQRLSAGETITLICSSECIDSIHCHRTL